MVKDDMILPAERKNIQEQKRKLTTSLPRNSENLCVDQPMGFLKALQYSP
jgi:hypothetical protein